MPASEAEVPQMRQSPVAGLSWNGTPRANDLSLSTLDYDEKGNVTLTGQAGAGATVRGYIDDKAVGEAVAACARNSYAVTAIVVDLDGVRQAVLRGNGAPVHTLDSAYAKAYTAASLAYTIRTR